MASPIRAMAGLGVDAVTGARLAALAHEEGIEVDQVLQMVLHMGLELCEAQAVEKKDNLAEIAAELRDLKALLHVIGRAAVATNLLMVHWASRSDGVEVDEDEMARELGTVAASRWAAETSALGIPAPVEPGE